MVYFARKIYYSQADASAWRIIEQIALPEIARMRFFRAATTLPLFYPAQFLMIDNQGGIPVYVRTLPYVHV